MELQNPYEETQKSIENPSSPYNDHSGINAGKRRYELEVARQNWEAEYQMMQYENWYNSPTQQAKRIRAAGGNPDLQGYESGGTSASGDPSQLQVNPEKNGLDYALQGLQTAGSLASTFVGGAGSIISMAGSLIQNGIMSNEKAKSDIELADFANRYDYQLPKSKQRSIQKQIAGSNASLSARYRDISDLNKNRIEAAKTGAVPGSGGLLNLADTQDKDLRKVMSIFSDLDYERLKAEYELLPYLKQADKSGFLRATTENQFQNKYFNSMDAEDVAGSDMQTYRTQKDVQRITQLTGYTYLKKLEQLKKEVDAGNDWAKLGMSILPTAREFISSLAQGAGTALSSFLGKPTHNPASGRSSVPTSGSGRMQVNNM